MIKAIIHCSIMLKENMVDVGEKKNEILFLPLCIEARGLNSYATINPV